MRPEDLLRPTPQGLYCPPGRFYIDPLRPVERALVTHGHSDHARPGHGAVMATQETLDIMRIRCGDGFAGSTQAAPYGEPITLGDVTVTFRPAGHILGSAQICVERNGFRIVAAGDYKDAPDPTCAQFEPIRCDVFISEATFGLPVFRHGDPMAHVHKLLDSVRLFQERTHMVGAYALGKAQRVIALMRQAGYERTVYLHGAMEALTRYYAARGIDLGSLVMVRDASPADLVGGIVICPPSALQDRWTRRFADPVACFASGWMRVRARARARGVALALIISDHADWDGLCATITATAAPEVWVTHGEEDALVHWCGAQGLKARPLRLVGYGEGEDESSQGQD